MAYVFNNYVIDLSKLPAFAGDRVYNAIKKSKQKTSHKKLLIGDSTANQFFDNTAGDSEFYSLACNQAVGLCGQFFLLNNYLQAGNKPEEVYLVYSPGAFSNNLGQKHTYHYFLKPFYRREYMPLMTENVIKQVQKIPYHAFCQFPLIVSPAWAPDYEEAKKGNEVFLSPVSIDYLGKIDSLREQYQFRLYIVPSLVAQKEKAHISQFSVDNLDGEPYQKDMEVYLNNIAYLPDTCFVDDIHLARPWDYKPFMLEIMSQVKSQTDKNTEEKWRK